MKTLQLQSIGHVKAIPATELKVGDVTLWNFGYTGKVLEKVSETKAFVTLRMVGSKGDEYERRLKKTRLVGIQ